MKISYSQCWEDPEILLEALNVKKSDTILSITSGGDNCILLLSKGARVICIDSNPTQNFLLELKLSAIKRLDYEKFLEFTGITDSTKRLIYFTKVKEGLTKEALDWWSSNLDLIDNGIINCGKFEKYLNTFRKYILPFIHTKSNIDNFLSTSKLNRQREFYNNTWNSLRWRIYFKIASNRYVLKKMARQRSMSKNLTSNDLSKSYIARLEYNLMNIPIKSNYFMHYCLNGKYDSFFPHYCQKKNFEKLHETNLKKEIATQDLYSYLRSQPDNYFSKFNLSDVFDALSSYDTKLLWKEIIRTSKKDAKIAYWENLINRPIRKEFSKIVKRDLVLSEKLHKRDKVFFYNNFHILTLNK